MRAAALAALLLAACSNTIMETSDAGPSSSATGVSLSVTYRTDGVVKLSVSGIAQASNRKFGPYSVSTSKVPSGGSIGLVFDDSDAGQGMTCVQSIESDDRVKDSDCATFQIVPNVVSHASVQLQ